MRDITERTIENPVLSEGWLLGAYTYSGVFVLDGSELTPEQVQWDVGLLYETTRAGRRRKWPRGLFTRFILVPVYCATLFPEATLNWLSLHRVGGRGIAMKPVLYNSRTHGIEFKEAMQNDTILLHRQLSALFADGIARASRHFGPAHEPNKPLQPTRACGPRG